MLRPLLSLTLAVLFGLDALGQSQEEAQKEPFAQTILDQDKEFEAGSKIAVTELTGVQTENLATLGQVWGFLKYHHRKVTSGALHWDFELFRIMPAVLAASDRDTANAVLVRWIESLGELEASDPRTQPEPNIHLQAETTWLENWELLGEPLSNRLRAVHAARPVGSAQFYVSLARVVGNPVLAHEPNYRSINPPDTGFQLLALFRFWNIIRYWFPYRDLIEDNWDSVLREFIPRVGLAKTKGAYQLELLALITKVQDTHANLWSSLHVRPPIGDGSLPVVIRFIEDRPVVADVVPVSGEILNGLRRGDIITAIDNIPVEELVAKWSPYYAASNEPTRRRDIARSMGRGPAGPARLQVQRGGELIEIESSRVPLSSLPKGKGTPHDLPGPAFRLISKDVAYLKLSSVKASETASYVEQASGTKGWIIDIRNYPAEFIVFALGGHFIEEPIGFARFTVGSLANPGAFSFRSPVFLRPRHPYYTGKVVVLVDETTLSQAEYTAMALRAAPRTIVIGSTTAAADGNVSQIPLPGGLHSMISGIGVFYPDKRPTQRVGIVPDIEVKPTLAGIEAGRDEILEAALREILGSEASDDEVTTLSTIQK